MADRRTTDEPDPKVLAELSALADGSLDADRAAALKQQIASSPELSERYAREQLAVSALRAVQADRAPMSLRARVDGERARRARKPRFRFRPAWGMAAAGALAAAVLAVILLLPAGTPGGPSVSQAASFALRGSMMSAPAPGGAVPGATLNRDVQEIYFPDWQRSFGWWAAGQRVDTIGGRKAVTVYYARKGQRIAYTIVASPALALPRASSHYQQGTELKTFNLGRRLVVTWRRNGHTCILSGTGVSPQALWQLAAWKLPSGAAA